jgi:hypothetical protein
MTKIFKIQSKNATEINLSSHEHSKLIRLIELLVNLALRQVSFEEVQDTICTDEEMEHLLLRISGQTMTISNTTITVNNAQLGDTRFENIAGRDNVRFDITINNYSNSEITTRTSTHRPKPIAQMPETSNNISIRNINGSILILANVIDAHVNDIEFHIGPSEEMNIRNIGAAEEIPQGGTTRWYQYAGYLLSINYDNQDIAKGIRLEGIQKDNQPIENWFELLMKLGITVRQLPSTQSPTTLFWPNYQGYNISVAKNHVDGVINIVRIFKVP